MLSQRNWRRIRPLLWPVAMLYWGVSWWRNFFYSRGFFISRRVPVPVVSIGNLSVGGTGKTPATIFVAGYLQDLGYRVGIVSRGYGRHSRGTVYVTDGGNPQATAAEAGDEPRLMADRLPGVAIIVDEQRYRGAREMIRRYHPDVIVLDDAFQHRGLGRNCDIVLLDAGASRRDYHIFPYGTLRERLTGLRRAHMVIWTRTEIYSPSRGIMARVGAFCPEQLKSSMVADPNLTLAGTGESISAEELHGSRLLAFCGIAKPVPFYHALITLGLEPELVRYYPDHHAYSAADLDHLGELLADGAITAITTEKDKVKLPVEFLASHRICILRIDFRLADEDTERFHRIMQTCLSLAHPVLPRGEA